jgi:acylphosphatase
MPPMSDHTIRRRLVVRGRVQGVFFRDSIREQAHAARVVGWAANRDDGSVEVVLEGTAEAVERVVRFCQRGPSGASVNTVESWLQAPESLDRFEIR